MVETLITQYSGLIWQAVNYCRSRLPGTRHDPEDLFQEGVIALIIAHRKHKPERAKFITFFTLCLRQHLAGVLDKARRERANHFPHDTDDLDHLTARPSMDFRRLNERFLAKLSRPAAMFVRTYLTPSPEFEAWHERTYKTQARQPNSIAVRVARFLGYKKSLRESIIAELREKAPPVNL